MTPLPRRVAHFLDRQRRYPWRRLERRRAARHWPGRAAPGGAALRGGGEDVQGTWIHLELGC